MSDYQIRLGERLRAIRGQQDLTLQDVEERSGGRWKAVVIGSYERGDRAVSIAKLAELAEFYGVPLADLLPATGPAPSPPADGPERLVLDLSRLEASDIDRRFRALRRYVKRIQEQRGDYGGQVLTLRNDDVDTLAVVFETDPTDLVEELASRRLLHTS